MQSQKGIWVALIAVAIIAVIALFTPFAAALQQGFGGVTNYDEVDATAIKIGGSSGTRLGPVITGACSLIAPTFTVTASTTVTMDCAVTGVVKGDGVFAQFGTSTPAFGSGWSVAGATASSTSGFISISVSNGTGATGVIPAGIASSTKFIVLHTRSTIPGL